MTSFVETYLYVQSHRQWNKCTEVPGRPDCLTPPAPDDRQGIKTQFLPAQCSIPDRRVLIAFLVLYICPETNSQDERQVGSDISTPAAAGASDCSSDVTAAVSTSDVVQEVEYTTERSGGMCVERGKQDIVIIFTGTLLTRLCA